MSWISCLSSLTPYDAYMFHKTSSWLTRVNNCYTQNTNANQSVPWHLFETKYNILYNHLWKKNCTYYQVLPVRRGGGGVPHLLHLQVMISLASNNNVLTVQRGDRWAGKLGWDLPNNGNHLSSDKNVELSADFYATICHTFCDMCGNKSAIMLKNYMSQSVALLLKCAIIMWCSLLTIQITFLNTIRMYKIDFAGV